MSALKVIDIPEERPVLALELPELTSFDEWVAIGRRLCLGSQALNWHIGDWWAFGDHRYGGRARAAAEGIFGLEFGTLANLASVARRFESSRRHEVLSFKHHVEVASLPPAQADELLLKAERERISANFLRREVQAIKAANDPSPGAQPAREPLPMHPVVPRKFVEWYIELAERMLDRGLLTRQEEDRLSEAFAFVGGIPSRHKCPDNFEIIFREKGRVACETEFNASRLTVNLWLIQRGKRRLLDERAAFVRFERDQAAETSSPAASQYILEDGVDDPMFALGARAANFLRISRYGGWTITQASGGWRVGTVFKTSDEVIAMAERQGFDSIEASATLRADAAEGVEG
jgi:hypothetical protein